MAGGRIARRRESHRVRSETDNCQFGVLARTPRTRPGRDLHADRDAFRERTTGASAEHRLRVRTPLLATRGPLPPRPAHLHPEQRGRLRLLAHDHLGLRGAEHGARQPSGGTDPALWPWRHRRVHRGRDLVGPGPAAPGTRRAQRCRRAWERPQPPLRREWDWACRPCPARPRPQLAWPAGSFLGTLVYLLLGGAELAAAERVEANITGEDPAREP